jgi:ADP-ribosyl-[dinitrogen reductase] hydrolase
MSQAPAVRPSAASGRLRRLRLLPQDRLMGGLLGLVIGDALGVPVEFASRAERDRDPVQGLRAFGTHGQPLGAWSDDGAMALVQAQAFVRHGWEPSRHLEGFLAWLDGAAWTAHGTVFDVGYATRAALRRFQRGATPAESGGRRERDNGNGSLMRMLPAACWWAGRPLAEILLMAGEVSALTHAHPRSRLCCALHALVADGLLAALPLAVALRRAADHVATEVPPDERPWLAPLLDGSCLEWRREQVPSDGHVVSTLIAALWCLHHHHTYADAVLAAVNLGDDTDTTGAVTGGLAGLRHGLSGIPAVWIGCLPRRVEVLHLAETFASACRSRG